MAAFSTTPLRLWPASTVRRFHKVHAFNAVEINCISQRTAFTNPYAFASLRDHRHLIAANTVVKQSFLPTVYAFDKAPTKLPDWWDDEDDEDDEEKEGENDGGEHVHSDDMSVDDNVNETHALNQNEYASASGTSKAGQFVTGSADSPRVSSGDGGIGNPGGGSSNGGRNGGGKGPGDSSSNDDAHGGNFSQGFPMSLITYYLDSLERRPIVTKSVTACILGVLGDYLSQCISRSRQRSEHDDDTTLTHDWRRSQAIALVSLFYTGPALHTWYTKLDQMISGRLVVAKKLLLDQLVFSTAFNAVFVVALNVLEGRPFGDSINVCRDKLLPIMMACWAIWPPVQIVTFTVVPLKLQPMFVNCFGLMWNVVLTYISHGKRKNEGQVAVK